MYKRRRLSIIKNNLSNTKKLKRVHFQQNETIVTIIAKEEFIETAKEEIRKCRKEIEKFIEKDEFFKVTFEPYTCDNNAPEIIKKMCRSSEKFNIGPMSTVAGIIAEYAVKAMGAQGSKYAIVDNGGDIAIFVDKTVNIGIYTGNKYSGKFAFQILPSNRIIGVCTSSGNIGHSFSFGNADAVTVISHDVSIADAAATALANVVNGEKDINDAFSTIKNVREVIGAAVFVDNKIGLWGTVPKIFPAIVPYELITKGVVI